MGVTSPHHTHGDALLYQTSRYVDIYKALDDIARERKLTPEIGRASCRERV